jgi:hypothetical protein
MKAALLILCLSILTTFVIGQVNHSKRSSSMKHYKHPLQTLSEKEKEMNVRQTVRSNAVLVKGDAGFKHPFNRAVVTQQYLVPTKKSSKRMNGNKHPLGL